ncbi:MAG TPA: AI-2E family transporter [Bacteroidia bacterium]|nr:AI-2E family transporter [Bacteroidia bacterium]
MEKSGLRSLISNSVEVSLRLLFLFLLVSWCLLLLLPFITTVLWGIIIAVSIDPVYQFIYKKLGNNSKLSATLITLLLLASVLVPGTLVVSSVAHDAARLGDMLNAHTTAIPPPDLRVADWPLIGNKIYTAWQNAYENPSQLVNTYAEQIKDVGKWVISAATSFTVVLFKLLVSIIIAGVLLVTPGTRTFTHKFFVKIIGSQAEEFASLVEKSIRNVTKGILGVAIIQSSFLGLLFWIAGVPYAGLLFMACLILGIVQLPNLPISIGVIIYLFSAGTNSSAMAILWTVLIVLASLSDNILKPILLGKGAPVPMLVIFLGSIGGFILSGFLGLFTGAIVLSIGYKLFIAWINDSENVA